jgi:hypothetical protein
MKNLKYVNIRCITSLAFFILSFNMAISGGLAQTDLDSDGFLSEGVPLNLPPGTSLTTTDGLATIYSLNTCSGETGVAREKCVSSTAKDLFVIIQRTTTDSSGQPTTLIPSPPYNTLNNQSTYNPDPLAHVRTGLGFAIHELNQASATDQNIGDYFAVKVIEDPAPTSPTSFYLGFSTFGTFPSYYSGGVATVWTTRIKDWIYRACNLAEINGTSYTPASSTSFICKNANTTTSINMKTYPNDIIKLYKEYIQNIVSHEVSHMIHLASATGTVDHHYTTVTGVLMEQNIVAKKTVDRNGNVVVTLYISKGYTKDDKNQYWLKAQ